MGPTVLLALAGFAIALYFVLVGAGVLAADTRWVPSFCRLDDRSCGLVLRHPHARLLGIPNSWVGIGYYTLVLLKEAGWFPPSWDTGFSVISWCVVASGIFLSYSLLAVIRVPCPLCFGAHAVNLLLALSFTFLEVA